MRPWLVLAIALCTAGCAELLVVKTQPPGAQVYLEGKLVGTTPLRCEVPRAQFRDHLPMRLELDGYQTMDVDLRQRFAIGRFFGALPLSFTLYAFKSPMMFRRLDDPIVLTPFVAQAGRTEATGVPAEIAAKLEHLERMRAEHVITEDEYRTLRGELLRRDLLR